MKHQYQNKNDEWTEQKNAYISHVIKNHQNRTNVWRVSVIQNWSISSESNVRLIIEEKIFYFRYVSFYVMRRNCINAFRSNYNLWTAFVYCIINAKAFALLFYIQFSLFIIFLFCFRFLFIRAAFVSVKWKLSVKFPLFYLYI